jgi:hypothetical protein
MKTRTDVRAGSELSQCQRQRDYWKDQAFRMELIARRPAPVVPQPAPQPIPQPTPNPSGSAGGGYVGSVWYSDRSGWCG